MILLWLWAALVAGFTSLVWVRLLRARWVTSAGSPPDVLLLRPVDAPSEQELENLSAPIAYRGRLEQLVVSPYRPRLAEGVRWSYSDPTARNRKVGHLLAALEAPRRPDAVVLSVDADVVVTPALVEALASAVASGADLAVAAPVCDQGSPAFAALLATTHLSTRALAVTPSGTPPVSGKAIALGPAAIALLRQLRDHVGEDLELGARLARANRRVAFVEPPARLREQGRGAVDRTIRWLQVIRAHRPALFWLLPLFIAPTWLLAATTPWAGPWGLAVVFALRTLLAATLVRSLGARTSALAWPLGEGLLLVAFAGALLKGARVQWRGRVLQLGPGGRIRTAHSAWAVASGDAG